jgi:DNA-binding response OmpR family regulator
MKKPTKILLIEDNPADVRLIVEMTRNERFYIENVGTLSDGLERLKQDDFTLILLDLSLPDSQGFETITSALKGAHNIPIVILTGVGDEELGIKAIQSGAQDYLVKGNITDDLLIRVLRYAMERSNLRNELEEIRLKHQQLELSEELKRSQNHFRAISKEDDPKDHNKKSAIDDKDFKILVSEYRILVLKYVRAIRLREERPSELVREFAKRLSGLKLNAASVVRIHISLLSEISVQTDLQQEKEFSNDARLVLIEILGNMIDTLLGKLLDYEK